ncbi:MAG: type II secretion system F family protein [Ectothiorhodospiraceae bacterium]|nr:type II secretion system F family protein [Ectothiorhodospiraceae bacterium]
MPLFQYKARGHRGDSIEGSIEAVSSDAVASQLLESGITPIEIEVAKTGAATEINLGDLFVEKVTDTDIVQFSRQMHSLTKAGVPLLSALHGLSQSTKNKTLAEAIKNITVSLEAGRDLATSFSEQPTIFSLFYVSMIRIGETTGKLDEIFIQLARYLERDRRTRAQIKSALRYPSFVLIAISIAVAIINLFVIPTFASVFAKFGSELPWATLILLESSNFTVAHWPVLLGILIAVFFGVKQYIKTDEGRYRWDKYKLKVPIVGEIIYRATMARFCRLFAISTGAGVPLITALTVVAKALDNAYVEERILGMQTGIERGESITRTAGATGLFDGLVMQMMAVGEETGAIDSLLSEVAEFYEAEVENDIDKLSARIEPILTVFIAGIVLVLALGVFLPMWNLADVAIK